MEEFPFPFAASSFFIQTLEHYKDLGTFPPALQPPEQAYVDEVNLCHRLLSCTKPICGSKVDYKL